MIYLDTRVGGLAKTGPRDLGMGNLVRWRGMDELEIMPGRFGRVCRRPSNEHVPDRVRIFFTVTGSLSAPGAIGNDAAGRANSEAGVIRVTPR